MQDSHLRCHQQNLHRLLALFAPEIHSPVQETGFVKYISSNNKAQRKQKKASFQYKQSLCPKEGRTAEKECCVQDLCATGLWLAWNLFLRNGCPVLIILEQGPSPGLGNWKEIKEESWGNLGTASKDRKGHSWNVTLPTDHKSHRGERWGKGWEKTHLLGGLEPKGRRMASKGVMPGHGQKAVGQALF